MAGITANPRYAWVHPSGTAALVLTADVIDDKGVSQGTFGLSNSASDTAVYYGTFPTSIIAGHYWVTIRVTAGGAWVGDGGEVDYAGNNGGRLVHNLALQDIMVTRLGGDEYIAVTGSTTTNITISTSGNGAATTFMYDDNHMNYAWITIWDSSSNAFYTRQVATWTKVLSSIGSFTLFEALPFTPVTGDKVWLHAAEFRPEVKVTVGAMDTVVADEIADEVWDETASTHVTAGSFGKLLNDLEDIDIDSRFDAVDSGLGTINSTVNSIKIDTDQILIDTSITLPAEIAVIDANVDAILIDTGTTLPADLAVIDSNVDDILIDTGTSIPATLTSIEGKVDVVDSNVDLILIDTGTSLPSTLTSIENKVDVVDSNVDDILVDTGTTIPALIAALNDPTVAAIVDAVYDELTSGHVAAGTFGKLFADSLDTFANSADVVVEGGGTKLVTIYEDDDSTVKFQVRISSDGLTRTRL